jgi:hypothetical protein
LNDQNEWINGNDQHHKMSAQSGEWAKNPGYKKKYGVMFTQIKQSYYLCTRFEY